VSGRRKAWSRRLARRGFLAALGTAMAGAPLLAARGLLGQRANGRTGPFRADTLTLPDIEAAGGSQPPSSPAELALPNVARDGDRPFGNVYDPATRRAVNVVTREEWGADESIRFDHKGEESWKEMFVPPRLLVVHHTASPNYQSSPEQAADAVRSIYRYHTLGRDWGDIGYHAIIDRFGNIYEGRHGRRGDTADGPGEREALSQAVTGGHTTEYEYGTVGVALLGNSNEASWPMPRPEGPMWDSLVRYCAFEAARSGISLLSITSGAPPATATTDFLRSDEVWHDGVHRLCGHREVQATACPGDGLFRLLSDLRTAVTQELGDLDAAQITLEEISPGPREIAAGTVISCRPSARWRATGEPIEELEYATEGWFKGPETEDLVYLSGYTAGSQPRTEWLPVPADGTITLETTAKGHYGVHVRAVLQSEGQIRRSAGWAQLLYAAT